MLFRHSLIALTLGLIIAGCTPDQQTEPNGKNVDIRQISTQNPINQTISNDIKDQLKKHDEITAIKAVNTPKTAVIAVEIDHLKRFKLADHRKTYKKEIEKAYPNLNVALSTDQKLIKEIDALEKKVKNKSISNKKLEKEVKRLVDLMKEQT
ncbi:MAG TPA: YhcN/YlaJ family sporulation lipoprotein [Bacillota bacterium]|nr:YhcN/YlaJ family sporulation lipoprotein [Bacillota bacterium]